MSKLLIVILCCLACPALLLAAEPEPMTWGHKRVDTRVVPHSFSLGPTKTGWKQGQACPGKYRDWAATLSGQIATALHAEGTLRHLKQSKRKKKSVPTKADWVLHIALQCQPKTAELTVTAVEQASATVVWTKKHSLPRVDQAKETIDSIARGLIAFAKEGVTTGNASSGGRGVLALLPLGDRSGRFKADQLSRMDDHLRGRLQARGFLLVEPARIGQILDQVKGDARDETFVVRLAEKAQARAGMSAWLAGEGDQCAFHFLLVPVAGDGEDRTAAVQVSCSLLDLKEGISQLVEQL